MTRREREVTDLTEINAILAKAKVLHLGLVDEGQPYIVPMNYGYTFEDGKLTLYMHGALKGYKMDVIAKNPTCCFELECDLVPFDAEVACNYGLSYSSVMGRGTVEVLTDPEEKMQALSILMKTQTGQDFTFNEKLTTVVACLRINVTEYTAKHRPMPKRP